MESDGEWRSNAQHAGVCEVDCLQMCVESVEISHVFVERLCIKRFAWVCFGVYCMFV